ncbi:MAG TPA: 1-acyl-sn-glycerol-3-phosphate acyltransferase [Acidimicrobiia bacterium]|nr:1-acyl-sn-glycerol-3-phosphate acyltransferase [Acidimicrobiia bacterium]
MSYRVLKLLGWSFDGRLPDIPKMVVIEAPHTPNWDFLLFLAALYHFDVTVKFLGKHTLFRPPLGWMFRKVGGVPVDRTRPEGIVDQVKTRFESLDRMILVIAPEGTRKAVPRWKSGFVEIARGADVPVLMAGIDSERRVVTISTPRKVGADLDQFMAEVRPSTLTSRASIRRVKDR